MPQFAPGEAKRAIAPITVRPSAIPATAELFLGPNDLTKVATSGRVSFISTGFSQNVQLPVTMPAQTGTYKVFLDVYAGAVLLAGFIGAEDVEIQPLAPVTIDSFQMRVLEWGPETRQNVIEMIIGLTNNTGKTLVDQTPERGRLRNSLYDETFKAPGTDYERDGLGQFWTYRPWDTGTIPSLPPGKTTLKAIWQRGATFFSTFLQERGVVEGTQAITLIRFTHADIAPTPIVVLYRDVAAFTGIFSSQWQTWQPTVFTPPEPPEEDGE